MFPPEDVYLVPGHGQQQVGLGAVVPDVGAAEQLDRHHQRGLAGQGVEGAAVPEPPDLHRVVDGARHDHV